MNFFWLAYCLLLIVASCGKKNNEKLADTYFKMSFLELSGSADDDQACKKALRHLEQALVHYQKPEYYAFKATLLFKLRSTGSSQEFFKKALALQPEPCLRAEIMNNYACLLAQGGQVARAQAIWDDLKTDTTYQTPEVAWVNLGRTYVGQKNLVAARDVFATAAQLCPSYLDAHFYLARTAFQLDDYQLMQRELDCVLALEPEHAGALGLARYKKQQVLTT